MTGREPTDSELFGFAIGVGIFCAFLVGFGVLIGWVLFS